MLTPSRHNHFERLLVPNSHAIFRKANFSPSSSLFRGYWAVHFGFGVSTFAMLNLNTAPTKIPFTHPWSLFPRLTPTPSEIPSTPLSLSIIVTQRYNLLNGYIASVIFVAFSLNGLRSRVYPRFAGLNHSRIAADMGLFSVDVWCAQCSISIQISLDGGICGSIHAYCKRQNEVY